MTGYIRCLPAASQVCRDAGLSEDAAPLRLASLGGRLGEASVGQQVIDDVLARDALIKAGLFLRLLLLDVTLHNAGGNTKTCQKYSRLPSNVLSAEGKP